MAIIAPISKWTVFRFFPHLCAANNMVAYRTLACFTLVAFGYSRLSPVWATGQSFTLVCCSDAYYSRNITNFYFSNGYDFLCYTFHQITDKCRLTRRCKWSGSESSLTIATVTMEDGTQWKVNCKYLCPVCTKVSAVFHCSDGKLFFAFRFIEDDVSFQP